MAEASRCDDYRFAGFLDRNPKALEGVVIDAEILGDPATYQPQADEVFVCGLGLPQPKMLCCRGLQRRGAVFLTIVHPTAIVSPFASIGAGSVLCAGAIVSPFANIGAAAIINTAATVDHDCILADGVHVSPGAHIGGSVQVGEASWIGIGAAVRQGIFIGSDVVIGAGAAVVSTVGDALTVAGVPARTLNIGSRT